jgi:hypothetical protein
MANKRYDEFASGTYDTTKIFLQADPITGILEKVNLPPISPWILSGTDLSYSNGGIIIGGAALNSKAIFELISTTKGMLFPRMTTIERDSITTPPKGLIIFNTTTNEINYYNGSAWFGASSSQWITVGSDIRYMTGKVGIGMTPVKTFDVLGDIKASASLFAGDIQIVNSGGNRKMDVPGGQFTFSNGATLLTTFNSSRLLARGNLLVGTTEATFAGKLSETAALVPNGNISAFELTNAYQSGSNQVAMVIRGFDSTYAGNATLPTSIYMYGGKNTTTAVEGNVILAHDGTNAKGKVAIGTNAPAVSSALDVTSTTKGVLFPRMTTTQKNSITSPTAGLVVFDTTLGKLCVYTTAWQTISSA